MSDNHPKIPKCKWFVQTLAGTWALAYRDAEGRLEDFIPLEPINEMSFIPDESVRYFAACVAECEWRKRAERWEAIRRHIAFKQPYFYKRNPIGELLSPDAAFIEYAAKMKERYASKGACNQCGVDAGFNVKPNVGGNPNQYSRIECAKCGAVRYWGCKPENINKRPSSSLNCAKHGLYCELCLRTKEELKAIEKPCGIDGHHIHEYQFGGETKPENTWDLCGRCHELVGWARKTYGHNEMKKESA